MAPGTSLFKLRRRILLLLGWIWRRCMFRTTFIAVSGSVGKSSCKEVIGEVLASRFPTVRTVGNENHYRGITRSLLRVRPWHKYAVLEIGLDGPGQMADFARTVRPDIAVWLSVARTHTKNFRNLETTAQEKAKLVESLRPGGIAVLNDDNPYIAAYQPPAHVRTIYCGSSERSTFRPSGIASNWPERLSLHLSSPDEKADVRTRFVGCHWVQSILPAFVIGKLCGIPLADAAAAIAKYEPLAMRMSPVELPNGATILRDDLNGSVDSLAAALRVMEDATAARKMIVFTDVSDSSQKPRTRIRDIGTTAARIADAVMFLGDHSEHGAKAAMDAGMRPDQVWNYYTIEEAAIHLRAELRAGDLVLLRGRNCDHLARLYLTMVREVSCWTNVCHKSLENCEDCSELVPISFTPLAKRVVAWRTAWYDRW
jgi:UDP-N-acetylmuramoyl-tripeptide--D-alanyl-D-alanine ligase